MSSFNPLAFLRVLTNSRYPATLKKLMYIHTLQCWCEGRCMTEVHNMWQRRNIRWSNNTIATWISVYVRKATTPHPPRPAASG